LLIGLDYFNRETVNNGLGYVWIRNVSPQGDENFVDLETGDTLSSVYLSRASIDNLLATTAVSNSQATNSAYSAYVSDVVNITPAVTVLVALRADYFDSRAEKSDPDDDFSQWALSPKFGLVYQPVLDKVSLFANYQNAFNNVAPVQVADPDGSNPRLKSFEPEQANQWEVGIKTNLFKDRLFATVSYYDIKVSNKVHGVAGTLYNFVQGGKVGSKGYEIETTANIFAGFSLIAGYSHNETKNLKGLAGDFYAEPGRAPGGQGPQNQVNFWATYKISSGALKNAGLGFGGNYASEYRVADNSITGVFDLPAYTVMNASLFYNADKFRVALNVNNVADTEYYTGYWSVNPQKPRNFVISMACKF
jgi:iron complex outermembrane receptor protein